MKSNFYFLQAEWPDLHNAASKVESLVRTGEFNPIPQKGNTLSERT